MEKTMKNRALVLFYLISSIYVILACDDDLDLDPLPPPVEKPEPTPPVEKPDPPPPVEKPDPPPPVEKPDPPPPVEKPDPPPVEKPEPTPPVVKPPGGVFTNTEWTDSHATFYGSQDGQGSTGAACGYGDNLEKMGYGMENTALSTTLFNQGLTCGACFEIKCRVEESRWCYPDAGSVKVTATNFCPPNANRPIDGWCNPPRTHFDMSVPMFTKLAQYVGGIIPIKFRRIPCVKQGGIRFVMNGNPWFNLVLVYNVAGDGNVMKMEIKGTNTAWLSMKANWGQNWELHRILRGQALSFRVTDQSGKVIEAKDVVPSDWEFTQTFEATTNF